MTGFESHINSGGDHGVVTWMGHTVFTRSWYRRALDPQMTADRLGQLEQSFASRLGELMRDEVDES